jgi:isoamylase
MPHTERMAATATRPGQSHPLGSTVTPGGTNFSLWSRSATSMDLLLYDGQDLFVPTRVIRLDPRVNRTFTYWHVLVPDVRPGQVYAWRATGPDEPHLGLRHDPDAQLLDPYAAAVLMEPTAGGGLRGVVADLGTYDWEGDTPLRHPFSRSVVYELHVKGFTAHPSSGIDPQRRGTYAGLVEKIPYLQDLGVTAVELMPVQAHTNDDAPPGLVNYWGYNPVSLFAPHPAYASAPSTLGVLDEFRDMVKALHRAGLEVILDVVFNHTAEGDETGRTLSWRGLDNPAYYLLDPADPRRYLDYTGCGNTLNANHPIVRRTILDALRRWVADFHVDGFRFDLASILSRDSDGTPMANPPVVWDIETDPVLAGTKIIAEAWDAAGLYQVGSFIGDRWREWNGRFRDDIRRFVRGDTGTVAALPNRLLASPDLYGNRPAEVEHSVNFVSCHDGFTLNDLVSYSRKHNEANLLDNTDGSDSEWSGNWGVEGATHDPAVERLRNQLVKSFLGITLISMGVPMLGMGDEVRRTQLGNNNAFCQDNDVSWFDWSLLERHADVLRFVRGLIRIRMHFDMTQVEHGLGLRSFLERSHVEFHGTRLHEPDLSDDSHSLALTVRSVVGTRMVHSILNMWTQPLDFELPPPVDTDLPWQRFIDTSLDVPEDVSEPADAPVVEGNSYRAAPHSVVLLVAPLRAGGDLEA